MLINGFYAGIKETFGRTVVTKIEALDDWKCLFCNPEDLKILRLAYYCLFKFWSLNQNYIEKCFQDARKFFTSSEAHLDALVVQEKVHKNDFAKDFAEFYVKAQQGLNVLQEKFLQHLNDDLGPDEERNESLKSMMEDV